MENLEADCMRALKVSNFRNKKKIHFRLNGVLNKFDGDSVGIVENLPRPRHIKSHLPIFMLPNALWTVKPKVKDFSLN